MHGTPFLVAPAPAPSPDPPPRWEITLNPPLETPTLPFCFLKDSQQAIWLARIQSQQPASCRTTGLLGQSERATGRAQSGAAREARARERGCLATGSGAGLAERRRLDTLRRPVAVPLRPGIVRHRQHPPGSLLGRLSGPTTPPLVQIPENATLSPELARASTPPEEHKRNKKDTCVQGSGLDYSLRAHTDHNSNHPLQSHPAIQPPPNPPNPPT